MKLELQKIHVFLTADMYLFFLSPTKFYGKHEKPDQSVL